MAATTLIKNKINQLQTIYKTWYHTPSSLRKAPTISLLAILKEFTDLQGNYKVIGERTGIDRRTIQE